MMLSDKPALLLVVFKQRKVGDPQKIGPAFVNDSHLPGALAPQGAQSVKYYLGLVAGHKEQQVAVFRLQRRPHPCGFLLLQEFFVGGAGGTVLVQLSPGQALGAVGLDPFGQLIDLFSGVAGSALYIDAAHASAGGNSPGKYPELGALQDFRQVFQLIAEPQVRLIGAKPLHALGVGHPGEGGLDFHIQHLLVDGFHEALGHGHNILLVDEGHFQVDLGKFRLPVGPQVLVPEAPGDLHIPVEARQHGQLLIQLRGLGQGKKAAGKHPAGHQVVSGPLGGGLDQNRGFHLHKAVLVEIVPGDFHDLMPGDNLILHVGAAQIQIAVFQPQLLLDLAVLGDLKGRGFAFGKHPQVGDLDLHLAGGDLLVFAGAFPHYALGRQHKFCPDAEGLAENFLVRVVVKGQLYNAGAVAQVDENQLSQVALPLGPSAYHNLLAHVGKPWLSAVVGSFQSCHHFCHMISSFRFPVIFPWFFVGIDFSQAVRGPACSEPSLRRICFFQAVCQNAARRRVPVRAGSPFHPLISSDCFARRNRSG